MFYTFASDNGVKHKRYMFKIGIDVGSTTVKVVVLDEQEKICFSRYKRHHAKAG